MAADREAGSPRLPPPAGALRLASFIMAIALGFLLLLHLAGAYGSLTRALHFDEAQYLHVGWLMNQGQRLYVDFIEDHAPHLFLILESLLPSTAKEPHPDLIAYAVRARTVTGACGVLALLSCALLAWRASGSLLAPIIAAATLLTSPRIWHRGLADVRNDPPTLFLFWFGTFLLVAPWKSERARFALAGTGIGLAATGAIWNPKTPLESVVLGAIYLWTLRQAFGRGAKMVALAIAPAIAIVAVAVGFILGTTSLREYVFFTFEINVIYGKFAARTFAPLEPFLFCDTAFKGIWPILVMGAAIAILSLRAIRARISNFDFRIYAIVLALAIAALLDIRFLFPYPNLWPQYYVMWAFILVILYGLTAVAVLRALGNARVEAAVQIVVSIGAVVLVQRALLRPPDSTWPWVAREYLQKKLGPRETVWLTPQVHPITAPDASYYWFAFADFVPATLEYVAKNPNQTWLPKIRQEDLPVCRAERGLDPNLRFVSREELTVSLPVARDCLDRMIASRRAKQTLVEDVWDLR